MNFRELKELARKADKTRGEGREQLVEKLIEELPKMDSFEGHDAFTIMVARMLARVKWSPYERYS